MDNSNIITLSDGSQVNVLTGETMAPIATTKVIPVDLRALEQVTSQPPSTTSGDMKQMDALETVIYSAGHVFTKAGQGVTALPRLAFAGGAAVGNVIMNTGANAWDAVFGTDVRDNRDEFGFSKAWEATDAFSPALAETQPRVGVAAKLAGNVAETAGALLMPGATAVGVVGGAAAGGGLQTVADMAVGEDNSLVGAVANVVGAVGGTVALERVAKKVFALDSVRKLSPGNVMIENEVARTNNLLEGKTLPVDFGKVRQTADTLEGTLDRLKLVATKPEELTAIDSLAKVRSQYLDAANIAAKDTEELTKKVISGGVTPEIRSRVGDETANQLDVLLQKLESGDGFAVLQNSTGKLIKTTTAEEAVKLANTPALSVITPTDQMTYLLKKHVPTDLSKVDSVAFKSATDALRGMEQTAAGADKTAIGQLLTSLGDVTDLGKPILRIGTDIPSAEAVAKDFVNAVEKNIATTNASGRKLYSDFVTHNSKLELDKTGILDALTVAEQNPSLRPLVAATRKSLNPQDRMAEFVQSVLKGQQPLSEELAGRLSSLIASDGHQVVNRAGELVTGILSKEDALLAARARNSLEAGHKVADSKQLAQMSIADEARRVVNPQFKEIEAIRQQWGAQMTSIDSVTKGQAGRIYSAIKQAHEDAIFKTNDAVLMHQYKSMNMMITSSKKDAAVLKEIIGNLSKRDTAEYGAVLNKIVNNSKNGAETLRAIDRLIPESMNDLKSKVLLSVLNPSDNPKAAMAIWKKMSPDAKQFYEVKFGKQFMDNYDKTISAIHKSGMKFDAEGTAFLPKAPSGADLGLTGAGGYIAHSLGVGLPAIAAAAAVKSYPLFENMTATAIANSPAITKFITKWGTDANAIATMTNPMLDKTINAIGYLVRKHKDAEGARLLTALTDERKARNKTNEGN